MMIWINADDFGLTKTCTDAIYECFQKGLITTTTIVANGDYFDYAIKIIKGTPFESKIGLHINLTEGKPLTEKIRKNPRFCDANGYFKFFPNRYSKLTKEDKIHLYLEISAQFDKLLNAGITINHVDSHHHTHNSFRILPIVLKIMKEKNVERIRIARNVGKINLLKKLYKAMFNTKIKPFSYSKYMGGLLDYENYRNKKDKKGVFEIMVHPDYNKFRVIIDRDNGDYSNPLGSVFSHNYDIIS